jgi:hypothetical protein
MSEAKSNALITIRDLRTFDDLKQVEAAERESLEAQRSRYHAAYLDDCHAGSR